MAITWATAASTTGDADTAAANYTIRQIITSGALSNTGKHFVRVSFEASSADVFAITKAYIGLAADSGDAYDFAATPTQLLFSGAATFEIAAGQTKVSDAAGFYSVAGKNIIVSFHIANDAAKDNVRVDSSIAGWSWYSILGDDAATVNTTGYGAENANKAFGVMKVETGSLIGGVMIFD